MNRRRDELVLPANHDAIASTAVDVDRFCSSSTWLLPAWAAFHAPSETHTWTDGKTSVSFCVGESEHVGTYLAPLEGVWGLGSPVVAPDAFDAAHGVLEALAGAPRWQAAMLLGIEARSHLFGTLVALLSRKHRLRGTASTTRHIASLEGGFDGYLSRRTRKFRANLRRSRRRASEAGITIDARVLHSSEEVDTEFERVLTIERRSWKSLAGNGVDTGPMVEFTRGVLRRAADRDAVFLLYATQDGADVGYLHGALLSGYFRGLQMSFDDALRPFGVGSLLQASAIEHLCERGARSYDLGSELPYKLRWAEETLTTSGLVAFA